jgi:cell wall-associated protease
MRAKAEYEKEVKETTETLSQYNQIKTQLTEAHKAVSKQLGKENYTKRNWQP